VRRLPSSPNRIAQARTEQEQKVREQTVQEQEFERLSQAQVRQDEPVRQDRRAARSAAFGLPSASARDPVPEPLHPAFAPGIGEALALPGQNAAVAKTQPRQRPMKR
jgi:hypothetical protein